MIELFRNTGAAKLPAVVEYIKDFLEISECKFLVFGHHKSKLYTEKSSLTQL